MLQQAQAAMRSTGVALDRVQPGSENVSLCHGHPGNAELFVVAREVLARRPAPMPAGPWATVPERAANFVDERYLRRRLPCPAGIPTREESPCLLLGNAGLGYFFLRLFDPTRTPSVLLPVPRPELA